MQLVVLVHLQRIELGVTPTAVQRRAQVLHVHQLFQLAAELLQEIELHMHRACVARCAIQALVDLPSEDDGFPYQSEQLVHQFRGHAKHRCEGAFALGAPNF